MKKNKKIVEQFTETFISDKYKSKYSSPIPDDILKQNELPYTHFRILIHIFNQTVGYGKLWDRISTNHFHKYTHVNRRTVMEALHYLKQQGWIYTLYRCRGCKNYFVDNYIPCPICKKDAKFCGYYSLALNQQLLEMYTKIRKGKPLENIMSKNDVLVHYLHQEKSIGLVKLPMLVHLAHQTNKPLKLTKTKPRKERLEVSEKSELSVDTEKSEIIVYPEIEKLALRSAFGEDIISFWDGVRQVYGWSMFEDDTQRKKANQRRLVDRWFGMYTKQMIKDVLTEYSKRYVLNPKNLGKPIDTLFYFENILKNVRDNPEKKRGEKQLKEVGDGIFKWVEG